MGASSYDLESNESDSPWDDTVCSMLGVDNQSSNNNVFPPINHEGLHIHSQIFPHSLHHLNPTTSPSKIPVTPCWNLCFRFMHRSFSYVHSTILNYSVSKIISFSSLPATAFLLVVWYSRVRSQRQALQKQTHDRLIRIVSQKDEVKLIDSALRLLP